MKLTEKEYRPVTGEHTTQTTPNNQTISGIFTSVDDQTRLVPAIEFRHVTFSYGDRPILDDISFEVGRGETLLVLSGSGGGKSTVLKLVMGLIKPDGCVAAIALEL